MARPTDSEILMLQNRLMRRSWKLTRCKADAADLVQDVMLKVVEKAPDLPLEQMIRWSLVVMRNTHLNICTTGRTRVVKAAVALDDQPELAIEGPQEGAVLVSETLRILNTLGSRFQGAIEAAVLAANDDDDTNRITRRTTSCRAREALRERMTATKRKAA